MLKFCKVTLDENPYWSYLDQDDNISLFPVDMNNNPEIDNERIFSKEYARYEELASQHEEIFQKETPEAGTVIHYYVKDMHLLSNIILRKRYFEHDYGETFSENDRILLRAPEEDGTRDYVVAIKNDILFFTSFLESFLHNELDPMDISISATTMGALVKQDPTNVIVIRHDDWDGSVELIKYEARIVLERFKEFSEA